MEAPQGSQRAQGLSSGLGPPQKVGWFPRGHKTTLLPKEALRGMGPAD